MRYWNRLLVGLGIFLLLTGGVRTAYTVTTAGNSPEVALLEIVIEMILIGIPGVAMMYIGWKLPTTSISADLYPQIVAWTGGGVVIAGLVVGLRKLHPSIEMIDYTGATQLILLSIGSITGLLAGVLHARTLAQANVLERKNRELQQKYELEKQNEQLKRTEQRLEEVISDLEASNDRLEEFAHAVSHDLQEPLRMVTSYLRLLESRYDDKLDEDAEEFIEFAVDGAERMQAMIDGLLKYSRVDTQGDAFDTVDLDAVLDDALTDLQFKIDESNAHIERQSLPTVEGDVNQLRQVFQNLISNAIDYSGDEPPEIRVTAECDGGGDEVMWTIAVSDNGVGINSDDTDRIFKIFQRLHSVDEQTGSGIGLAVCRRIVKRHGGEIWVDSEPSEGSTFFFTLPDPKRTTGARSRERDPVVSATTDIDQRL